MNNQIQNVSPSVGNLQKRRRIIYSSYSSQEKQKPSRVVTIAMTCSTLASLSKFWKFFEGLYITQLNFYDGAFIVKMVNNYVHSQKSSTIDDRLGFKYDAAFTFHFKRLFKRFISLKYFTLNNPWNMLFLAKYFTSFNWSKMLLNI